MLDIALWLIILASALVVCTSQSLVKSVVFLSLLSLSSALLYLNLQAPDVAFTEAAIGAAISTIFILTAIQKIGWQKILRAKNRAAALTIACAITFAMFAIAPDMPAFGGAGTPALHGSSAHYIQKSYGETEVPNMVTSVLASYRGFDTLGEVNVILAATVAVFLILPLTTKAIK